MLDYISAVYLKTFYSIAVFLAVLSCHAQDLPGRWIGVDDGLSQGYIYNVNRDKRGFLWFGSKMGLNRYDGYEFVTYHHKASDQNSISGNEIIKLICDDFGNLIVHTDGDGVNYYYAKYNSFLHFSTDESGAFHLPSNVVIWIAYKKGGELLIMTDKGLVRIQITRKKGTDENITSSMKEDFLKHFTLKSQMIPLPEAIEEFWKSGRVYTEGNQYLLHTNNAVYQLPIDAPTTFSFEPLFTSSKDGDERSHAMYAYPVNDLIFMADSGLYIQGVYHKSNYRLPNKRESYFIDEQQKLWMVLHRNIITFDFHSRTFDLIRADYGFLKDESFGFSALYKDDSGLIWAGTVGHGIFSLQTNPKKFQKITNFNAPVRTIYGLNENLKGNIIAECQGRLVEVDVEKGEYVRTLKSSADLRAKGFNLDGSRTAIEIEDGVYLAVHKSNLWKWNEKKQTVEAIYLDTGIVRFSSFCHDVFNNVWICSSEGLIQYDVNSQKLKKYPLPIETDNMEYFWRMAGMIYRYKDSDFIWICTYEGLLQFAISKGEWNIYRNDPKNPNSLSQNLIFSVCADPLEPQRYLWIGTSGSGISKLDFLNNTFTHYTSDDGLSNNYVYGILSDKSNRLWMSTNKGISCLDLGLKRFVNYQKEDGLQGNEFNRFSYFKTSKGKLVFGGVNGLTFFDPELIVKNTKTPSVAITNIKVNNSNTHPTLFTGAAFTNILELDYKNNNITFQFAALEFTNPELNQYRYKMIGVANDWIDIGYQRTVNFSSLAPGEYTFIVNGSNSDGLWSDEFQHVQIVIHPPWWETWWFRLALLLFVSVVIYGAVKYRINQLRKLQLVRDRIARDLHDEIGSTLSSISIYSEVVKDKVKEQVPEAMPLLSKISSGTGRVMESMSDIVWTINSRNDSVDNLSARIRSVVSDIDENTHYSVEFYNDDSLEAETLDMEKRKNIYLIFKEALNNAMKYSHASKITVVLKRVKNKAVLKVMDNGKGFDVATISNGNGLVNMKARAASIGAELSIMSESEKGTIIQLEFSLR